MKAPIRLLRRIVVGVTVAFAAHSAAQAQSAADRQTLSLLVGEQRVIPSAGVSGYSEGTHGVVDVRLTKDAASFILVGQREGRTSLLLVMDDGSERVLDIEVRGPNAPRPGDRPETEVTARDNIRLDFYFVQVSRDSRRKLGIAWPGSIGGGTLSASYDLVGGSVTDASAVVADQALPRLDMAQAEGWAKVMRQAAFVTANGSEAKVTGGGELNVPIEGGLGGSLARITFGTQIEVLPRYDRESGRLELTIRADVSDLTGDGGTGVPGRTTSTLHSVVNLELGQSVVLAGLRAQSESVTHAGLPWLSQIPLLGGLFGSHSRRADTSEQLVLIVPSVVEAVSLKARADIEEAMRVFDAYAGDLERTSLTERMLGGGARNKRRHD